MKKSEWNDKQLEELLQSMPKVSDRQSPNVLYQKIQARLQEDQVQNTKKKTWVLPSIATVAALILIFLITSNMMDFQSLGSGSSDKMEEKSTIQNFEKQESSSRSEAKVFEGDDTALKKGNVQDDQNSFMSAEVQSSKLLDVQLENHTIITVSVNDVQGDVAIPLSMQFSDTGMTRVEMLHQAISSIQEEELGVHNIVKDFKFEEISENEVKVIIPNNQGVSASGEKISTPIIETLRWMGYQRAQIFYEDGRQVEDPNMGVPIGPINLQENKKGFVIHHTLNGNVYIVPTTVSFNSLNEAFEQMSQSSLSTVPSIEPGLIQDVKENGSNLTINFSREIENTNQSDLMLKAILLTAKDFGYTSVKFTNTPEQVGDIFLKDENGNDKEIAVPYAPNYLEYLNK